MRKLLSALVFASLIPAAAAEEPARPSDPHMHTVPLTKEVPYPLELGYPYCIRGVVSPEYREEMGLLITWQPPHNAVDIEGLNYGVELGYWRLEHCNEEPA